MHRPRLRTVAIIGAALATAAVFAAVGGATTSATAPTNTALPTISGAVQVGGTLTTTSGSWSGTTPFTFTYKWEACDSAGANCTTISGATAQSYKVDLAQQGNTLRSLVSAKNAGGTASASSDPTSVVAGGTPPKNTALPTITGNTSVGSTLSISKGTWTGTAPITYQYQWRRCDTSGNSCANLSGADNQTYTLVNSDSNHTLRATVTATNATGQSQATTNATATVGVSAPANSAAPSITGSTAQGQTLTVSNGTWTGATPIAYTYLWERCDGSGNNCAALSGATKNTYATTTADVGHDLRALVTATNSAGSNHADSNAVGPIASTLPAGAVTLPNGEISIPASSVPDTDQLLISSISFSPTVSHGRQPVQGTFKVTDANKYVIVGALVFVEGLPYNWMAKAPEAATGANGQVTFTITPTKNAPLTSALVMFVRARTPQGDLLAGSSSRRLIQLLLRP